MAAPAALPPEIAAQNKGPRILVIVYVFTILASLFVAGRIFSRIKKLGRLAIDDYLILISLALGYIYLGFITVAVRAGTGRHAAVLSIPNMEKALFCITIGFLPGIMSYTVPKFAVVILVTKILSPCRWQKWVLWSIAIINLLLQLATIAVIYTQCDPPRSLWTIGIDFKCRDHIVSESVGIASGGSSAFVDFYLALYPATVLWQLQMALRKKLVLSTALGFGICAGSVAIYKSTTIPGTAEKTDFTFVAENLVIWVSIEANCVIMAACIPILMPLAELIFGKNFLSNGPSSIKGLTSFLKKMSAHTKMSSIEMMSQTARREIAVNQRGVESQESILPRVEAGLNDGCNNIIRTDRIEIGDKNRREDGESIRGRDRP